MHSSNSLQKDFMFQLAIGDQDEEELIAAGRPQQTIGSSTEQGISSRRIVRSVNEGPSRHKSRLRYRRKMSVQTFQSHLANERSFTDVLGGIELEEPRPNVTYIEPELELPWPFLLRLRVNTFAVPLGLSSQAQLWGSLADSFVMTSALGGGPGIPSLVQWIFWILSLVLLVIIGLAYTAKATLYWGAVKREWAHPIRSSFMLTPLLTSLTLITGKPSAIQDALHPSTTVPLPAFLILSGLLLYMEMASYGKWLFKQSTGLNRANPSYQLAVVGNFLVASLGTQVSGSSAVETVCAEMALMFFSVGILYQLMVFFAIQQNSASNIVHTTDSVDSGSETPTTPTGDLGAPTRADAGMAWRDAAGYDEYDPHQTDGGKGGGEKAFRPVSAAVVSGWGRKSRGANISDAGDGADDEQTTGDRGSRRQAAHLSAIEEGSGPGANRAGNAWAPNADEEARRSDAAEEGRRPSAPVTPPPASSKERSDEAFARDLGYTPGRPSADGNKCAAETCAQSGSRAESWPNINKTTEFARRDKSGQGSGTVDVLNTATFARGGPSSKDPNGGSREHQRVVVHRPNPRPFSERHASPGALDEVELGELGGGGGGGGGGGLAARRSLSEGPITPAHGEDHREGSPGFTDGSSRSRRLVRQRSGSAGAADHGVGTVFVSSKLHPIYFLFIAPPSAASVAWKGLSGEFDMLARSLFFIAGFLYLFFALRNLSFLRTASFSLAWWAYTFPSSTFAFAAILYAEELESEAVAFAALTLALASTLMVIFVFGMTVSGALKGTLFGRDPVLSIRLQNTP